MHSGSGSLLQPGGKLTNGCLVQRRCDLVRRGLDDRRKADPAGIEELVERRRRGEAELDGAGDRYDESAPGLGLDFLQEMGVGPCFSGGSAV